MIRQKEEGIYFLIHTDKGRKRKKERKKERKKDASLNTERNSDLTGLKNR